MKKRINPALFRSYIYYNFLNYNNVIQNHNTNALMIWQEGEIKDYLTDFFKTYLINILNINITRAYNMLNLQIFYIPSLTTIVKQSKNFCKRLMTKLNYLKYS